MHVISLWNVFHCLQDFLTSPSHSSTPPSPLTLCVHLFTCCSVWSPPVEWASCSDMSPFSVLVCFPHTGDSSSGGAPPSTDSQPTSEDTVMDLDGTEVSDTSESSPHCTICNTMPQLSSRACPVLCCPCPVLHAVCMWLFVCSLSNLSLHWTH